MNVINRLLPIISLALAVAVAWLMPNSKAHPRATHPYFLWVLLSFGVLYILVWLLPAKKLHNDIDESAKFYAGTVLFLNILNLLTVKLAVING